MTQPIRLLGTWDVWHVRMSRSPLVVIWSSVFLNKAALNPIFWSESDAAGQCSCTECSCPRTWKARKIVWSKKGAADVVALHTYNTCVCMFSFLLPHSSIVVCRYRIRSDTMDGYWCHQSCYWWLSVSLLWLWSIFVTATAVAAIFWAGHCHVVLIVLIIATFGNLVGIAIITTSVATNIIVSCITVSR